MVGPANETTLQAEAATKWPTANGNTLGLIFFGWLLFRY